MAPGCWAGRRAVRPEMEEPFVRVRLSGPERGTDGSSDCEEERAHTNPGELEGWAGIVPEAH